jgi:hypothetical protein
MVFLLLLSLVLPVVAAPRDPLPTPIVRTVDPRTAKVGDEVTVTGEHLGKDLVVEVYLTDRTDKTKVTVLEQNGTTIRFKVPAGMKPAKYWVMVLANLPEPILIEQPAPLIVEQ